MDDPEALARYRAAVEDFKKNDNALRSVVKDVIGSWMNDPVARSEFVRRWAMAQTGEQMARALFDPKDDGAFIRQLAQIVPGLDNERDRDAMWKKVAAWFSDNLGGDTIPNMGDEAYDIAMSRGIDQSSPADAKTATNKLVTDGGYLPEEAETIMKPVGSMSEADALTRYLVTYSQNGQQMKSLASQIDQARKELEFYYNKASDEKLKKEEREQYKQQVDKIKLQIKGLHEQRAKFFLDDYMRFAQMYYNMDEDDFGYKPGKLPEGVTDVPTAAQWLYRRHGVGVDLPQGWREDEKKEIGEIKGDEKKGAGGSQQTSAAGSNYKQAAVAKGYKDTDAGLLARIEPDPNKLPPRAGFAEWYAKKRGFNTLQDVEFALADRGATSSTQLAPLYDPNADVEKQVRLIEIAAQPVQPAQSSQPAPGAPSVPPASASMP